MICRHFLHDGRTIAPVRFGSGFERKCSCVYEKPACVIVRRLACSWSTDLMPKLFSASGKTLLRFSDEGTWIMFRDGAVLTIYIPYP